MVKRAVFEPKFCNEKLHVIWVNQGHVARKRLGPNSKEKYY